MSKEAAIEMEGIIVECLPNAEFIVEISLPVPEDEEESTPIDTGDKPRVRAHISGKMRMNFIKINPGDRVTVELSPYDMSRGRITYRHKLT